MDMIKEWSGGFLYQYIRDDRYRWRERRKCLHSDKAAHIPLRERESETEIEQSDRLTTL